jgi:pyruvate kinase
VECAVPEVLDQLADDAEVWIDDGKVATTLIDRDAVGVLLRVAKAPSKGAKIKPEKGLNFPGTHVQFNPLTDKDLNDLETVVEIADIVGYSFIKDGSNIDQLFAELEQRTDRRMMLIAKIETQEAILNLPDIIVRAGGRTPFGIMIARGDLAVEIGYQRLSEMQEEILWVCEAASIPVVWATQVLEHAVKDGVPSRAEVTDAAMSGQAECVMLNKGAYITDAIEFLNNVLSRMQGHHTKKWNRMRALKSWH